jgi:hypothetical protein
MNVKHIDIGEFRQIGFLQEANRLFFHPHGLALEVTMVDEGEGGFTMLKLPPAELAALRALVTAERGRRSDSAPDLDALTAVLEDGDRYADGDTWISGVWDYRDDPEGIVYGEWDDASVEKVRAVSEQRRQHFDARAELFGARESYFAVEGQPSGVMEGQTLTEEDAIALAKRWMERPVRDLAVLPDDGAAFVPRDIEPVGWLAPRGTFDDEQPAAEVA